MLANVPHNSAGDRPAHLLGHHHQAAPGVLHGDEIRNHEVRACGNKKLGGESMILGAAATPCAAMDVDQDRCVRSARGVNIKLLDFGWAVGDAERCAQPSANQLAVSCVTLLNHPRVGCVDALIVCRIEFSLIVVEEDSRTFLPHWWSWLLCQRA